MNSNIWFEKYFRKRFYPHLHRNTCKVNKSNYKYFIIIPIYNEYNYILQTLESIRLQEQIFLNDCLIILVINNTKEDSKLIQENNLKTHQLINQQNYNYEYVILDYYSKKNALDIGGVGIARKIGMDFSLLHSDKESIFCSLDADTIISQDYLKEIHRLYYNKNIQACTVNFKHQPPGDNDLEIAIDLYEKKIKDIAFKIKKTGSPYGYVSMGSTMITRSQAYVAVGGMSKKNATEDFYFLQALAKYTKIYYINKVLIYPSSRPEQRVYLGTGFRMIQYQKYKEFNNLGFRDFAYQSLKLLIDLVNHYYCQDYVKIKNKLSQAQNDSIIIFLNNYNFEKVWDKFCLKTKSKKQFILFFHQWFDALKTIKFLKALSYE